MKKKLNLEDVKAVGGCRHDALVHLLNAMGYEIEAVATDALVSVGDRVTFHGRPAIILGSDQYALKNGDTVTTDAMVFVYVRDDGQLTIDSYDWRAIAKQEHLRTKDGCYVRGYRDVS